MKVRSPHNVYGPLTLCPPALVPPCLKGPGKNALVWIIIFITLAFFQEFFQGVVKSIVMRISILILIILSFSYQIAGGAKVCDKRELLEGGVPPRGRNIGINVGKMMV